MIDFKDIINGLEQINAKRFEDNRFVGDISIFSSKEDIKEEYGSLTGYAYTNNYGEGYLMFNISGDAFNITIKKDKYQDQIQESWFVQELTLQGVSYFVKYIIDFNDDVKSSLDTYYISYLKSNNINVSLEQYKDLCSLAVFEPRFGVSIFTFEANGKKIWLTFRDFDGDFKYLSKVTIKSTGTPVKLKAKHNLLMI